MRRFVDLAAVLGGWALLVYSVFVAIEILGRRYLGYSLQGVDEVGGYLMAIVTALGLSFALYQGAHVRIDLLLPRLSPWLAMWLNVAALLSLFGFAVFLLGRAWNVVSQSYSISAVSPTPLRLPMIIPQAAWTSALFLFVLATLAQLVRAVRFALRGEAKAVADLVGTSTTSFHD